MRLPSTKREGPFQTSVGSLISLFLRYCDLKGLSPRTVDIYREKLMKFLTFLDGKELREFDPFSYISWLRPSNSSESINIHLRHLKVFFKWAKSQGFLKSNPLEGIP